MQTASVVRKRYERIAVEITYRCRRFIILVDRIANANPEHDECARETHKAKSNAACSSPYPPQSCNERVESKYLTKCAPICLRLGAGSNRGGDTQE